MKAGVLLLAILLGPGLAPAEPRQVHGESARFAGHGVALVWGVLRGPDEAGTQVLLRAAPAGGDYAAVSLDGVDPFTGRRQELAGIQPLGDSLDLRTSRETFADLPRREVHFYARGDQAARRPALTVYFLGLPDTTPEFASEAALRAYLGETLAALRAGSRRSP